MMLTQHPGQLEGSAVGRTIVETVPTMILFPNDRADPADYAFLRLGEKEAGLLTAPHTGTRAALVRSAGESVVVDADLAGLGPLLTILGGGSAGEALAGPRLARAPRLLEDDMTRSATALALPRRPHDARGLRGRLHRGDLAPAWTRRRWPSRPARDRRFATRRAGPGCAFTAVGAP